jgi:hypothetical protein
MTFQLVKGVGTHRESDAIFVSFGALVILMEAPPEIYPFPCAQAVPNPHQDSEVNSLWSMGRM